MSASVSLRKRRAVASRPITNRPQTITGQQNKALNEEQERERQAKELDARRRRARRRLDELERINYRDAPSAASASVGSSSLDASMPLVSAESTTAASGDGESGSAGAGVSLAQRRRNQAEIKRILVGGRRNLHSIVEELMDQGRLPLRVSKGGANWRSARSNPSERPGRKYCSICGYHGDLACIRCGHRYCSKKCRDVHDETRCERPLR
ncbi:related to VPS71 - nucleosome-binding component of the SWR1 complex [Ustilago trichophora]|uniref:Related to VPS71 - nucleosome-binding component of the SWR1 complex n=1 Tax=Ustilago trichophora TaxID=86804 RepID=A0A5C3ECN0_9BASI|nr:related to VPS71 - nucleosome-binding component of the SWR1 complex [Ustilago trichophora]